MKKALPPTKVWKQTRVQPDALASSCQAETDADWHLELAVTVHDEVVLLWSRWSNEPIEPRLPLESAEEAACQSL